MAKARQRNKGCFVVRWQVCVLCVVVCVMDDGWMGGVGGGEHADWPNDGRAREDDVKPLQRGREKKKKKAN